MRFVSRSGLEHHVTRSRGYAASAARAPLTPFQFTRLLRRNGTLTIVGVPESPFTMPAFSLIGGRRSLAGSLIGGIRETQEMLDFCAQRGIVSDIELIPMRSTSEAYERMLRGDVKDRFVIDLATLGG
jgi:uncharacterized zinc-type alcohol dehydrogenase-like protein